MIFSPETAMIEILVSRKERSWVTRACPVVLSGLRAFRCVFPERCQKRTLVVGRARLVPLPENLIFDSMLRCKSAGRQGVLLPGWVW